MQRSLALGVAIPVAITAVALFFLAPLGIIFVALNGISGIACLLSYARATKRSRLSALAATFEVSVEIGRRNPRTPLPPR